MTSVVPTDIITREPRRGRHDAEERLITAAADLLGEIGPRAMSVRLIAERAGVNHGLVHHYFEGKEGLLRAAMSRLVEEHAVWATQRSQGDPIPTPFALREDQRYLRAVVRALLDGETELAEMELTQDVSVPRRAMQHIAEASGVAKSSVELKAAIAVTMAIEMGWAVLEPFLFAVTETSENEAENVRKEARHIRHDMVTQWLEKL
jgi:AcrR family transcriptional regulator